MYNPFEKQNPFIKPTGSQYQHIMPSKTFNSFAPRPKYSSKRHFISDTYIYQATILDRAFKERDYLNNFIESERLNLEQADDQHKIQNELFLQKIHDHDPATKYIGSKENPFHKKYLTIQPIAKPTEGYYSHTWEQSQSKPSSIGSRFMDPLLFKTGGQIQDEYNKTRKDQLIQKNKIDNIFRKRKQEQQKLKAQILKQKQRVQIQKSKAIYTPKIKKSKQTKQREKSVKVIPIYQQEFQDDQLNKPKQQKITKSAAPSIRQKQNSLQKEVVKYLFKTAKPDKVQPISYGDTFGGDKFLKRQQFEKTGSFRELGPKRQSSKRIASPRKSQQASILRTQHSVPEQYTNVNLSYSPAASEDNSLTVMNSKRVKKAYDQFESQFVPQDPRKVMQDLMNLMPEAAQDMVQSDRIRKKLKKNSSQASESRNSGQSQNKRYKQPEGYPNPDTIFDNFGFVPISQNHIRQEQQEDQQDIPNVAFEAWNFGTNQKGYPAVILWRHKEYQLIND